jgi:hypothetical protein
MPAISKAQALSNILSAVTQRPIYKSIFKKTNTIYLFARFSATHHGFLCDLIQGVQNTATFNKASQTRQITIRTPSRTITTQDIGPISCNFVSNGVYSLNGTNTQSSNLDPKSKIFGGYIDGEIPKDAIDREDYILQTGNVAI